MDIPVYLFTGFLDSGKTSFIQETLEDERFNSGEKTLLIVAEEGEVEYDIQKFASKSVYIKTVDNESDLSEKLLSEFVKETKAKKVMVEYNGMWQLSSFFNAMPKNWIIYQEMTFAEGTSFVNYNQNMRSLVADKLAGTELLVLNRCDETVNKEEIHAIVRSVSRKADIAYEYLDKHVEYDDIKDPLPFDIEADVITIKDTDYAIWYFDLMEDASKYNGKKVEFLGIVAKDKKMGKLEFAVGRHIMTCCVEDIKYGGLVANGEHPDLKTGDWVRVCGKLKQEYNELYGEKGPVLKIESVIKCEAPEEKVVTLY